MLFLVMGDRAEVLVGSVALSKNASAIKRACIVIISEKGDAATYY